MKPPYKVIKFNKITREMEPPVLLLMTRSFDIIGIIPHFTEWNISLVGNGMDEISFTVHKYVNGYKCPVWDDLIDLKIIDVRNFGRFEISVNYTDNTETVKSIHGISLEAELAQIPLYEFHVNDDDAIEYMTEKGTDKNGNFIPTVFYNPTDKSHSLLHRVLADKAPHWTIGYVTPYIALNEESQPESSSEFQRTYTCDGTTIYDFLTGEVSEESNVIFIFDTINREINCYSLCDCIDQETGEVLVNAIGEDTFIYASKDMLANEITISSNKDNVKNCFRIEGGDDVITDMVRVVNMNGSNYIYQFADFQYNDMPEELVSKLKEYQDTMSSQDIQDEYYGENGIYTRLCKKYDDLAYYESSMMPDVSIKETTAEEQYNIMVEGLKSTIIGVSSVNNYNNNLFVGVTNNIEAMANVLIDARYQAKVIEGSASYDSASHTWTGNIQITRAADDTDYYPKNNTEAYQSRITVHISDDELTFTRQKIEKALAKGSMLDIDFDIANMDDDKMKEYFSLYSLNRLKSFYDGYNSCLSILMSLSSDSSVRQDMYDKYYNRLSIVSGVLDERQKQVDTINADIENITKEQQEFQDKWNFQKFLGDDLYKIYCSYRREDTYKNDNYISDGLSTSECLAKAKELVEVATKEAKKACVLQRTVSTSLNNLFALPLFEPLYESFALFNYIRIRTEDELLRLRLIGIDFNGESVSDINVTFSEQIESVDGTTSDLQSIIQQASSMATSFPSTTLQAKKGAEAQSTVSDMFSNGLNAAKTMLASSDDQDVTITKSGIICRRKEDEGYYSNNQLRITNNVIGFTRDGWKTVSEAIGEILYTDPITGEKCMKYGVIAEAVIGQLIAGENMYIGNKNGSVQITGNGIDITNGKIHLSNGINSISLDPDSDMLFQLKNIDNDSLIMGVDNNGAGYFKGKIHAASWESDNFKVDEDGAVTSKNILITGGNINIKFSENVPWGDSDNIRSIDYTLMLDYSGLSFEQLDDMGSYFVDLKADGLTFNGSKVIDNPGSTFPSVGNIGDVTTYDGISLRDINSTLGNKVDTSDIINVAHGGTGATTAEQARNNLGITGYTILNVERVSVSTYSTISENETSSIDVTWNGVRGATGYIIALNTGGNAYGRIAPTSAYVTTNSVKVNCTNESSAPHTITGYLTVIAIKKL